MADTKLDYSGQTRRIDLILRTKYPQIRTRIYKIANFDFKIYVGDYFPDFAGFSKEFDNSIRFITVPTRVVNRLPEQYIEEIKPIEDTDISSAFEGMPFTTFELVNHIQSIHPNVEVGNITTDFEKYILSINLVGSHEQTIVDNVLTTAEKLKIPMEVAVTINAAKVEIPKPDNPVFFIHSSQELSRLDLPFLRRDEELWFDKIADIYSGKFQKTDLFFYKESEKSCLINFSIFKNIDLRNALLLYDVIYCTLPLLGELDKFFELQKMNRKEFLYLVANGRIRVLINQPEFRHEWPFFREIYDVNQNAIVSRRALAALCAIDIVEMNRNYIFNDSEIEPLIIPLASKVAEITGADTQKFINAMLWPKIALRSSFDSLNNASTKRICNYGVNTLVIETMPNDVKDKYEFEFIVNAEAIHMAHALDATYFPFRADDSYSDQPYALMMGNILNFYKFFNKVAATEYMDYEQAKSSRVNVIDPINVFDVNTYIPIEEFEKEVASKFVRQGFQSIFDELSTLNDAERIVKVQEYNEKVISYCKTNNLKVAGLDLATDTVGLVVPFLGTAKNIASFIHKKAKNGPAVISKIAEKIEEKAFTNITGDPKISLLSRLNRVARIKKDLKKQ